MAHARLQQLRDQMTSELRFGRALDPGLLDVAIDAAIEGRLAEVRLVLAEAGAGALVDQVIRLAVRLRVQS